MILKSQSFKAHIAVKGINSAPDKNHFTTSLLDLTESRKRNGFIDKGDSAMNYSSDHYEPASVLHAEEVRNCGTDPQHQWTSVILGHNQTDHLCNHSLGDRAFL